jgi:hypothetical protein
MEYRVGVLEMKKIIILFMLFGALLFAQMKNECQNLNLKCNL